MKNTNYEFIKDYIDPAGGFQIVNLNIIKEAIPTEFLKKESLISGTASINNISKTNNKIKC